MKWNGRLNKKYTQISTYVIFTAIIIYVLALMAKNAPAILSIIMDKVKWLLKVIKPITIGFVLAYLFEPVVMFFQKRLQNRKFCKKKPRRARFFGVLITVLLVFLAIATLVTILAFSITNQIRLANLDDLVVIVQTYAGYFTDFISSIGEQLKELNFETQEFQNIINKVTNYLTNWVTHTVNSTAGSIGNITGTITTLAFSIIIGVWFMIDGTMMTGYLNRVMYALFNQKTNQRVHNFLHDADNVFSGYIRGQLMDAIVMMCLISISLSIIGLPFSVVIGVIAGFGNLVPYLGPIIAYGCSIVVCLINGQFMKMLVAIIVLCIIQAIDGNFIGPKLLSESIEVHPLLVIISLIFGSAIGGFLGMLLAVPVGALIKLLFVRYIDAKVEKKDQELGRVKVLVEEKIDDTNK